MILEITNVRAVRLVQRNVIRLVTGTNGPCECSEIRTVLGIKRFVGGLSDENENIDKTSGVVEDGRPCAWSRTDLQGLQHIASPPTLVFALTQISTYLPLPSAILPRNVPTLWIIERRKVGQHRVIVVNLVLPGLVGRDASLRRL